MNGIPVNSNGSGPVVVSHILFGVHRLKGLHTFDQASAPRPRTSEPNGGSTPETIPRVDKL